MVETIRISEMTAEYLKRVKGSRSYDDVIQGMIKRSTKPGEITALVIAEIKRRRAGRKPTPMSEHIDEIVYGVARP